jgi:hypothetical protein
MEWDVMEVNRADGRIGYLVERGAFILAENAGNGNVNAIHFENRVSAERVAELLNEETLS